MSVAELKLAAISEISKLQDENSIREILDHLARISKEVNHPFDVNAFLDKSSQKYDDLLKKLAQ